MSETGQNHTPRFSHTDAGRAKHQGYVRKDNQDEFLVGGLARTDGIEPVAVADEDRLQGGAKRVASLAVVADGAGGGPTAAKRPGSQCAS